MKVTLSPLVAALRGRAAATVAVVSRGVQYIKKHGRPHGPPSQAQLDHRAQMQRLGRWWRSLPLAIRTFLNLLGAEAGKSGFAIFTQQCTSMHSVEYDPNIIPENPHFPHIVVITSDCGRYPGDIAVNWDYGNNNPNHYLQIFYAAQYADDIKDAQVDDFVHHTAQGILLSAEYAMITGLRPMTPYWVIGIVTEKQQVPDNTVFGGGRVTRSESAP